MSNDQTKEDDFADVDEALFNGKPLSELDEDDVIEVAGEAETGFEPVAEQPVPEEASSDPEETEEPEETPAEGMTPAALAAVKDERRKRQAATAETQVLRDEVNQLKGMLQTQVPQPQMQTPQIPNPAVDPQGYHDYMMAQTQQAEAVSRLNMSQMVAVQRHGEDLVNEAMTAFEASAQADPTGHQARHESFGRSPDPVGQVVGWYKQQQLLSEIGDDPEAYKNQLKEQILAELQGQSPGQQAAPQPPAKPNLPPRMAAAASAMPTSAQPLSMDDVDVAIWGR